MILSVLFDLCFFIPAVSKPKPLSTVINPAKTSKVLSNAMLINAVLDRIAEVRAQVREDEAMYNKRYFVFLGVGCHKIGLFQEVVVTFCGLRHYNGN